MNGKIVFDWSLTGPLLRLNLCRYFFTHISEPLDEASLRVFRILFWMK
jgi:hypothetical protein